MTQAFASVDEAFMALADPTNPAWGAAFAFLASHPETASTLIETFRETLAELGVESTGTDPATGEPVFDLKAVARAMGLPESDLELAAHESMRGD
jgi:hypothetical protein